MNTQTQIINPDYDLPRFSKAFERFIKDYESGFKSVRAMKTGALITPIGSNKLYGRSGLFCLPRRIEKDYDSKVYEIERPEVILFEPINLQTEPYTYLEKAEDHIIDLLLQACPVDKDKILFWRCKPRMSSQVFFGESKRYYKIYTRVVSIEGRLIEE